MARKTKRKIKKKLQAKKHPVHFHLKWTSAFFVLYLALSLVYSPEFLFSDMRSKFSALADETIMITAKVLAPPVKPVVSANAICNNAGNLYIDLNWADDEGSTSFNISRDGSPLVSGLSQSQFRDQNLIVDTTYAYEVTAIGSMGPGFAISDSLSVTTPAICEMVLPSPELQITSFEGKPAKPWKQENSSENKKPIITGTTNIPNAVVDIFISGSQMITATIQADLNGYWNWKPPMDLLTGEYSFFVSATDQNDPLRTVSAKIFVIIEKKGEQKHEDNAKKNTPISSLPPVIITPSKPSIPTSPIIPVETPKQDLFDFSLLLGQKEVLQGKNLDVILKIKNISEQYANADAKITYLVYDEKLKEISSFSQNEKIFQGAEFKQQIPISKFLAKGKYYLEAQISLNKKIFTQRKSFQVLELPILNLGGGFVLTYPRLLSMMGTASILLLLLVLLWLFLFSREYWLYLHSLRHITERNLEKMGFFSPKSRKGVSK